MRLLRILVGAALGGLAVLFAWAELEHWMASRRGFEPVGDSPGSTSSCAVVVLGFRNRGTRANYVNRVRVRAGIRTLRAMSPPGSPGSPGSPKSFGPERDSSLLVLCGGPTGSSIPESMLMGAYARKRCGYTGNLVTEAESMSTSENIRNAIPLIEHADRIAIASNSLHAEKARSYLRKQRPDLAARLVPARDYRFGELILLKPAMAALGRRNLRRLAAAK